MVSTELGACEWFVWDLRRSNLIERGQLDQVVGEFLSQHPDAEPPALSEHLVQHKLLTEFQAERLLQGKTQGFVLGPFTLMDALGTGSMGTVYKAVSKADKKPYAVKVLPRRSMWNVRLARRKVRAFDQCQHPGVVPFVDVGTSGGMHYLAWPMVEGETLEQLVKNQGKLPPAQAAHYLLQSAEALAICHTAGLFHGLLKASNLMLGPDGRVRILDFGIGCLLAETEGESLVDTMSTANSVASGLDCASPESIMDPSNLTPAGDQYSLGCVFYFLLTGQYPFPDGTAVEKMMAHQFKEPTPIRELSPDVPAELVAIVERLMKKAPEARYASTDELMEALRPFTGGSPAPVTPKPSRLEPVKDVRRDNGHAKTVSPSDNTPRPPTRPAPRTNGHASALPSRQSLQGHAPAKPAPAPPPLPIPQQAAPQPKAEAPRVEERPARKSLEERLGTFGVVLVTVLVCAMVWLLTRKLF